MSAPLIVKRERPDPHRFCDIAVSRDRNGRLIAVTRDTRGRVWWIDLMSGKAWVPVTARRVKLRK